MEENEVIKRAKNGDNKAFDYLYKKYKFAIYAYFMKKVNNKSTAEDLTQEVFVKLYNNFVSYDVSKSKISTFIAANARQVYIDYVRKENTNQGKFENNVTSMVELTENESEPIDNDKEMLEEDIEILRKLISELCESQRTAIEMRYFENKSYKEIAKKMGKTELGIKSILHRARKNLRQKMKDRYPEMDARLSKKYITKMIIMIAIGISAVTGLAYATYRIYNDVINNDRYTLSELREEVPESESIITRDEALNKINYYLSVLGEEKVSADELKLVRYIKTGEIYWKAGDQANGIQINSINGSLVSYNNAKDIKILRGMNIDELYEKLNLPMNYEMYKTLNSNVELIEYAKKYGEIYNTYEGVRIYIKEDNIKAIGVSSYSFEDTEILISKEKALEIAKDNNIEVQTIELAIENINSRMFEYINEVYEELDYDEIDKEQVKNVNVKVRKVWKIFDKGGIERLIDVGDGSLYYNLEMFENQNGE